MNRIISLHNQESYLTVTQKQNYLVVMTGGAAEQDKRMDVTDELP